MKRRRFWIDPSVQAQFLATVLVLVTGSVLLVAYSVARGVEAAAADSGHLFHSVDWFAQSMRLPVAASAAVSILISGIVALVWSHRVAGPLRVLAAAMDRLRHGDMTGSVRVRRNDTLHEIVEDFSLMQDGLREILASDRDRAKTAGRRLVEIAESLPEDDPNRAELEVLAQEIKEIGTQYRL